MELQWVAGGDRELDMLLSPSSADQSLPAQWGGEHHTCTLWAKTHEGEASESGSMHPPTPARTPCHLPPLSPNSSLGQGLAPASRAPGRALGRTLCRCTCQASPVASQGPSWAGPRQVPQCCSQPDCSVQGAGAEQGPPPLYHHCQPHCQPCTAVLALPSTAQPQQLFQSPCSPAAEAVLFISPSLPNKPYPMVLPAGGVG